MRMLEWRRRGWPLATFAVLAAAAALQFIGIRRLTDGDFLNSYPFISPDGFDWIYEGAYLRHILQDGFASLPPSFILRHPMFVFVGGLDAAFGGRGVIFALTFAGSLFAAGAFLAAILRELGVRQSLVLWAILVFVLSPFSYFRPFVLADSLAIAFLHANIYVLIRYRRTDDIRYLLLAVLTMLLGGWTQTYGVMAFGVAIPIIMAADIRDFRRMATIAFIAGAGLAFYLVTMWLWYRLIPHEMVPKPFALLAIKTDMAAFYANIWTYFFGPLVLAVGYCAVFFRRGIAAFNPDIAIVAAIVVAFAVLLFFYQWPEARFTYFYFGLVVVLAAVMLDVVRETSAVQTFARRAAAVASLALLVLTSVVVVPPNYWQPSLAALRIAPRSSWLWEFFTARPLDRFALRRNCQDVTRLCPAAQVPTDLDPYRDRTIRDYRALTLIGK